MRNIKGPDSTIRCTRVCLRNEWRQVAVGHGGFQMGGRCLYKDSPASVIPGNLNSSHPTEKCIFHLKLPLEADGREGQQYRVIEIKPLSIHSNKYSYD